MITGEDSNAVYPVNEPCACGASNAYDDPACQHHVRVPLFLIERHATSWGRKHSGVAFTSQSEGPFCQAVTAVWQKGLLDCDVNVRR